MKKEELTSEFQTLLRQLEEHTKLLGSTVNQLKSSVQGDANLTHLQAVNDLLADIPEESPKQTLVKVRRILEKRIRACLDDLCPTPKRRKSETATEDFYPEP